MGGTGMGFLGENTVEPGSHRVAQGLHTSSTCFLKVACGVPHLIFKATLWSHWGLGGLASPHVAHAV